MSSQRDGSVKRTYAVVTFLKMCARDYAPSNAGSLSNMERARKQIPLWSLHRGNNPD